MALQEKRHWWDQPGAFAFLAATFSAVPLTKLAMNLSGNYYAHKYPHDGQIGLAIGMIGVGALPASWIFIFLLVFFPLKHWVFKRDDADA